MGSLLLRRILAGFVTAALFLSVIPGHDLAAAAEPRPTSKIPASEARTGPQALKLQSLEVWVTQDANNLYYVNYKGYDTVSGQWKQGNSGGYTSVGTPLLAGDVVAWVGNSGPGSYPYSTGYATYDSSLGQWQRDSSTTYAGVPSLDNTSGVVAWVGNSGSGSYPYSTGYATYDSSRGQWQRSGSTTYAGVPSLNNNSGVVAWIGNSGSGSYPFSAGYATYDPSRGQWQRDGSTTYAGIPTFLNYTGVVAWIGNSGTGSYPYSTDYATYDTTRGQWQRGGSTTFAGIPTLITGEGVVAWVGYSGPGLYPYSAGYAIYDPSRGQWQPGGSSTYGTIPPVSIINTTVSWNNDGTSYTRGYKMTTGQWYDGPTLPAAWFTASPASGNPPLSVWFNDMSIAVTSASWDFGDGSSESGGQTKYKLHIYDRIGLFTATETVTGPNGSDSRSATIRNDFTPPTGTVSINNGAAYTNSTGVTLTVNASDNNWSMTVASMRFSNDNSTWSTWENYYGSKSWTITAGEGQKTVYAQFRDPAGNISVSASDTIILDTTPPADGTLTASAGNGLAALSWTGFSDTRSGVAGYTLYYSTGGASGTQVYTGTATERTHTNLANGTVYNYRLVATDQAGNNSPGATASATPRASGYLLTTAVNPAGAGTTNPAAGTYAYSPTTTVNLSATASTGYQFNSWTGGVADPGAASTTVAMTGDKAVTANFIRAGAPTVTTAPASSVTAASAALNGSLVSLGTLSKLGASGVNVSFEWGTTAVYSNTTSPTSLTAAGNFSIPVTGLSAGTTYHFRARADGNGTAYGDDSTFTTQTPLAVTTDAATAVTHNSATLNGNLSSLGSATSVVVNFTYYRTSAGGGSAITTTQAVATATGPFSYNLTGLLQSTGYTYQARADAQLAGSAVGESRTFTTFQMPVIAFASRDIYRINYDGTGRTRLTTGDTWDTSPTWKPDGTRIAFSTQRDGQTEIYSMKSDGTEQTRLTNNAGNDVNPAWSPDGTKIAWASTRDTGTSGIRQVYTMSSDGSNVIRVTGGANTVTNDNPAWKPDGTKLAIASNRPGGAFTGIETKIWTINPDGSGAAQLTSTGGWDWGPAWSPDGNRIAFATSRNQVVEIWVMNSDGSGQTKLTADGDDPCWTADGARILFNRIETSGYKLYVMNSDGSGQTRIEPSSATVDWYPAVAMPRAPLSVTTAPGDNVTTSSFQANGQLDRLTTYSSVSAYFEWGNVRGTYLYTTPYQTMNATGAFSAVINFLTAGTEYHCRAVIDPDGAGPLRPIFGDDITITTLPYTAPTIQAETAFTAAIDGTGSTEAAVINVKINRGKNPATGATTSIAGGVGSYAATATPSATGGIEFVGIRESTPYLSPTMNTTTGAFSVASVAAPEQPNNSSVGKLVTRLIGPSDTSFTLTVSFSSITAASGGASIPEDSPKSQPFRRGDANNNGTVDVFDAMFIAQYIVGNRPITDLNVLNAACIKHDGAAGDKIDIFDAMFIAQMIVGIRNNRFE